eukprot:gene2328-2875_t
MDDRFNNAWGSIGLVYSEIAAYTVLFDMMKERKSHVSSGPVEFSHIINLSLNDFPTKSINELGEFLNLPNNLITNFLDEDFPRYNRINKTFLDCNKSMAEIKFSIDCGDQNELLKSIDRSKYSEGSQWHFLTRKFVEYIISDFKPIERLLSMKFSFIPDESYFQIIKSEWNENHTMKWNRWNFRYIQWNKPRLEVSEDDIPKLQTNRDLNTFFARKVYDNSVRQKIIKTF